MARTTQVLRQIISTAELLIEENGDVGYSHDQQSKITMALNRLKQIRDEKRQ